MLQKGRWQSGALFVIQCPMSYQYIFWDNDGVLVDTECHYLRACREALARYGVILTEAQFVRHSLIEGRSVLDLAQGIVVAEADRKALKAWRNQRYNELLCAEDIALAGVADVLQSLHGTIGMAVVTSSLREHFATIHQRTGFLPYFDFWLNREDYTESKPSAEPYLVALARCGHRPEEVLVIEDSPRGVQAAKQAGLTCWVIPSRETKTSDFSNADRILGHVGEVTSLLL
jgi:HAD superfamily hydrolase (TIGR01509 family)